MSYIVERMCPTPEIRLQTRVPDQKAPVVMHQHWESLLFLHWEIDPHFIQKSLPEGLQVDTYNNKGYLGIVPFFMNRIRPTGLPPVPGISWFLELNVRTYVFDRQGIPGVWFYSLDCNQPLAVWIAQQMFNLPYLHAQMSTIVGDGWTEYRSQRVGTDLPAVYRYAPKGSAHESVIDSLEFFLLERYYLYSYSTNRRQLYRGQVAHQPYQYSAVSLHQFSVEPARYDGFLNLHNAPDHQCFVQGLKVKVMGLQPV